MLYSNCGSIIQNAAFCVVAIRENLNRIGSGFFFYLNGTKRTFCKSPS